MGSGEKKKKQQFTLIYFVLTYGRQETTMNTASDTLFEPGGSSTNRGHAGNQASVTMSDLFSSFTRHISPAFNHERPDRSVQMRLYTMHKGQHLLIFIMFLCLFFIAILMGLAGPRII